MSLGYVVMGLLVLTALAMGGLPFLGRVSGGQATATRVDPVEKLRGQLNELLYDFEMGKLPKEDYLELKARLEQNLAELKSSAAAGKAGAKGRNRR